MEWPTRPAFPYPATSVSLTWESANGRLTDITLSASRSRGGEKLDRLGAVVASDADIAHPSRRVATHFRQIFRLMTFEIWSCRTATLGQSASTNIDSLVERFGLRRCETWLYGKEQHHDNSIQFRKSRLARCSRYGVRHSSGRRSQGRRWLYCHTETGNTSRRWNDQRPGAIHTG